MLKYGRVGVNTATLAATLNLTDNDKAFQILDPGGASRTVKIWPQRAGTGFVLRNTGSVGELLNVTDRDDNAIISIDAGETYIIAGTGVGLAYIQMAETTLPDLNLGDSVVLSFGDAPDVNVQFDGTDFEIDSVNVTGKIKVRLGTDTSATSFVVENDSAQDLITVTGAGDHASYIQDNSATAYAVNQAGNGYIAIDTTDGSEKVTLGGATNPDVVIGGLGDIIYSRMTLCVITVADVTGGATDGTCDVDVQTLDGVNVGVVKTGIIYAATADGAGSRALSSTVTFSTATAGAIKTSGNGYCVFETDATGNFTCTVSNSADETVYFSVATADGGVDGAAQGMWVAECVTDAATWSA